MSTPSTTPTETTKIVSQQPAFTIREDETGAHVLIALPGVRKEDLKLTLKQSVLEIEAARRSAVPEDWKTHSGHATDVTYVLGVRLTAKLDGANVRATLDHGVLTLHIPIREDAKPREIYVN